MSNRSPLARHRRTVGGLATALVAVGVAVGSGANFSAQTANPGNTFASGTLSMDNSKANAAILNPTNMKPGDTPQTGDVDIQNTGSVAGTFSLSRDTVVDSDSANPMSAKTNIVVVDCGAFSGSTPPTCDANDPQKYSGTLAAMSSSIALGSFSAGEKHRYRFSAQLDSSAGDAYQGDSTGARFQWDAVQ